jgi:hypothetical protein
MKIDAIRTLFVLSCLGALSMESAAAATLSGVVVDKTDAVIPGVSVDLYSGEHEWNAKTDAVGHFRLPDLAPGNYDLQFTSPGFRKRMIQGLRIGSSDPAPISVTLEYSDSSDNCPPYGLAEPMSYEPVPGKPGIKGAVKFYSDTPSLGRAPVAVATPDPLAGAVITVSRDKSSPALATAHTNKSGEFEFPDLGSGLYALKAARKGYIDIVMPKIRVRPGKVLRLELEMHDLSDVVLCQ